MATLADLTLLGDSDAELWTARLQASRRLRLLYHALATLLARLHEQASAPRVHDYGAIAGAVATRLLPALCGVTGAGCQVDAPEAAPWQPLFFR